MIALVTGGSGCGKSTWAEGLVLRLGGRRFYLATMPVVDGECEERVARHRAQRAGKGFETVERPVDIGASPVAPGATALIECLPTLMANEMFGFAANPGPAPARGAVERVLAGVARLTETCGNLVIVTNDVFSDGLAYDPATASYQRALADVNRAVAARADLVVEVVFSIPVVLKGGAR